MDAFDFLLQVADRLLSPNGCPWDQKQTFKTLQPYVLEEAHEVVEAVDSEEDDKIVEELGDLLYTIIFYAKLAQKEDKFTIKDVIDVVTEKLIRRHPHVFGETQVKNADDVVRNWETIKKAEKKQAKEKSVLDAIPPTLPTLMKAQKLVKKMKRAKSPLLPESKKDQILSEEKVGEELILLLSSAEEAEIDVESALRRALAILDQKFSEEIKE
jgi:tetrapyrrole methylase family protein/MazG family protein